MVVGKKGLTPCRTMITKTATQAATRTGVTTTCLVAARKSRRNTFSSRFNTQVRWVTSATLGSAWAMRSTSLGSNSASEGSIPLRACSPTVRK